jgi:hypothetical protein
LTGEQQDAVIAAVNESAIAERAARRTSVGQVTNLSGLVENLSQR